MHRWRGLRFEVLEGTVDTMTKPTRLARAEALGEWADVVDPGALVEVDTAVLQDLGQLAAKRDALESDVRAAVEEARRSKKSWSEIGAMLGVSKWAVQRKYSTRTNAV